ncbi:hypothetical protein CDL15_Pgr007756 [Punica granatum]|uniref:Uncharacterized protein n=1 Tax=Punica granatum TaxID=22663 RepID=A0A218XAA6_PUNGR|nr:hypothetical protein CDL15_Pgr007756 [Punica granatum]
MKKAPHGTKKVPLKKSFKRLICRVQIPTFLTIFCLMVLMIIYADEVISNLYPGSNIALERYATPGPFLASYQASEQISIPQLGPGSLTTPLLPPLNSTREARIRWLQEKLLELEHISDKRMG